ncbi:MAG: hypothetical protein JOY73_04075, partial [Actinobacteria bacterium]|nr:hypothetical protein [Actinomycetota bacterium]
MIRSLARLSRRLSPAVLLVVLVCAGGAALPLAHAAGGTPYATVVLADHPVGYWKFNEQSGTTATDSSGHGINGTYEGSPTLGVPGPIAGDSADTAVQFAGVAGQLVSFGDNFDMPGNQPFTVEVWVEPSSVPTTNFAKIASKFDTGPPQSDGYALSLNASYGFSLDRWLNGTHTGAASYGHVVPGRWYYVVATYDGSTTRIYVNGEQGSAVPDPNQIESVAGPMTMGDASSDTHGTDAFSGALAQGAVYTSALSLARIRAHYAAAISASNSDYGLQKRFQIASQPIDDRESVGVNVATGNLLVQTNDMQLPGINGLDLNVGRVYNGLGGSWGMGGPGWRFTLGQDVRLVAMDDGSQLFENGDGAQYEFIWNGSSFATPQGLDETLAKNGSGFILTDNASGTKELFSSAGQLTAITDKNDSSGTPVRIGLTYNSGGQLTTATGTQGNQVTFQYNSYGLVDEVSDTTGGGRFDYYHYNSDATLTSYEDAAGNSTSYGYDSTTNALDSITDPDGNQTTIGYDSNGRVSSITRDGSTTSYSYPSPDSSCSGAASETKVTDPDNNTTTYCFDSRYRVINVVDALGNTFGASYSGSGQNCVDDSPCSTTDAYGHTTTFGYNAASTATPVGGENLLYTQSPLEGTTNRPTFAYGNSNHPYAETKATDAQGNSWNYNYDEGTGNTFGNLTSTTEGDGDQNPVRFTYNSDGTVATATDGKGNKTTYGYTNHNLTSITPPSGSSLGSTSITYDSRNRVSTITDGAGHTRTYTYDALDRVTQIAYTGGPTLTYTYDADGNLTQATDPTGTYSYHYDALNRLTEEDQPGGVRIDYGYDAASNLTALTDASGTTRYGYNADNEVSSIPPPGSNAITLGYDKNGNRTEIDFPNGVSEQVSYDNSQRISGVIG